MNKKGEKNTVPTLQSNKLDVFGDMITSVNRKNL